MSTDTWAEAVRERQRTCRHDSLASRDNLATKIAHAEMYGRYPGQTWRCADCYATLPLHAPTGPERGDKED